MIDTFAPVRNALNKQVRNAQFQNQLQRQGRQDQMQNRLYQMKEKQYSREEAMARLKVGGPLAKLVMQKPELYPQARQEYMTMFPESQLPETIQEAMPKIQEMAGLYDQLNPPKYTVQNGQYIPSQPGQGSAVPVPGYKDKPTAPSALKTLIGERDALDPSDPNRAAYDAVIASKGQKQGLTVRTNPDGTTEITQGPVGGVGDQTKGRTAADKAFAAEYVKFKATGGYADIGKQLNQLNEVVAKLESGANLTGPIIGLVPDIALSFTNPEAISAREGLEEVVQRNLKAVLGGQFTEREGEKLVKRALNPSLPEPENAKRVRRLMAQIEIAAKAKQSASDYFEKHGTLTGWNGKLLTLDDFKKLDFSQEKRQMPDGAAYGGVNPKTGEMEYFDAQGNKL